MMTPLTPQFNSIGALSGAANLVGGILRDQRLKLLELNVTKKRDALKVAEDEANEALNHLGKNYDGGAMGANVLKTFAAQSKVDTLTKEVFDAQSLLDRAQSSQALWQAGTGGAQLAQNMGYGYGNFVEVSGGAPVPIASQAQGQQFMQVGQPGGGSILVPLLAGAAGGYIAGTMASAPAYRIVDGQVVLAKS